MKTPKTNAAEFCITRTVATLGTHGITYSGQETLVVKADFARELECELNAANERLANQYRLLSDASKKIRSLDDKLSNALADLSLRRDLYKLLEKERDNLYEQIQNIRRDA